MTKSVVFVTNHVWESKRRAGFHGLAAAFAAGGWQVGFVATGISQLSRLKHDRRLEGFGPADFNRFRPTPEGVDSFIYVPLLHPVAIANPTLETLAGPVFRRYGRHLPKVLTERFAGADVVIFESSPALFFVDHVRSVAPGARLVYRVSDNILSIRNSRHLITAEDSAIPAFDLISVPSRILLKRFPAATARFHPHGLDYATFDGPHENPFPATTRPIAVSVGSTLFDYRFIDEASEARPDVDFHLVGNFPQRWTRSNVFLHGELPFRQAAAYSAHCTVALAPYDIAPGAEYLAETSNKIIQYRYLKKPIVTHAIVAELINLSQVFGYDLSRPGSAASAIQAAIDLDMGQLQLALPPSWSDVRDQILSPL